MAPSADKTTNLRAAFNFSNFRERPEKGFEFKIKKILWVPSVDSHHPGISSRTFSFLSSLKVYVAVMPSGISGALGLRWAIIRDDVSTVEVWGAQENLRA